MNVIDDQHVLAGRSYYYAESLFGKKLKKTDFTVKLITEADKKGIDICSAWERIISPGQFIDCQDDSDKKEFVIRRMNFEGKEIKQIRMDANQSTGLHTITQVSFYDDQQQPYILEVADSTYCRLNLITSEQIIAYEEDRKGKSYTCSDVPFWKDKVSTRLSEPISFGGIGQNRYVSNRYSNPKFR
ncbi:hypothetical protein ACO0LD_25215 [Undibacterium sp. Ji83W]|uniref:hypothetical protein n=1 Tax=Undibacterium sp. Ji83W TaxID=3413043 RepID=UPI003BF3DA51